MSTKIIVVPEPLGPPTRIDDFRHALVCKACVSTGIEESEARCYDPAWRCGRCDRIYDFSWREFDSPDLMVLRWLIELEAAKKRFLAENFGRTLDALLIHGNVAIELVDFIENYFDHLSRSTRIYVGGYVEYTTPGLRLFDRGPDLSEQEWLCAHLRKRIDESRMILISLPDSRHSMDEVRHFYEQEKMRIEDAPSDVRYGFVGTAPQMPFYALCHRTALKELGITSSKVRLVPLPVGTGCSFGDDMAQVMLEIARIEDYIEKGWIIKPPSDSILDTYSLY